MTTRIQHLMEALYHLNQVNGLVLEKRTIKLAIQAVYETKTEDLTGQALIDRLTDEELAGAIRSNCPRLGLYQGGHIDPSIFGYIRRNRPTVAAVEFSRRGSIGNHGAA